MIVIIGIIAAVAILVIYVVWMCQPSGVEAEVQIIKESEGSCVFEYEGKRETTAADTCDYLPGETVTVWQNNAGAWRIKTE